jgi:hypothetical protein
MSEPGSLPCPMFPHSCQCAHVPLSSIQRALLHPDNRGDDGADEDVDSAGLSPHKVFLMARRRRAEAQMADAGAGGGGGEHGGPASLRGSMLVRTATEMRHFSVPNPLAVVVAVGATAAGYGGGAAGGGTIQAVLADRQDELNQLRAELQARPVTDVIPKLSLRSCCLCERAFAVFEGAQCLPGKSDHFLCNVCFGGYLMKACAPGGCYEQELRNEENMVVSPPGKLPCPFFRGHYPLEQQLPPSPTGTPRSGSLPDMDCQCGAISFSVIERTLLDPRNSSVAFWRERRASSVVGSFKGRRPLVRTDSGSALARGSSGGGLLVGAWAEELLSRNFTPANVHETARLRVSVLKNTEETQGALTRAASGATSNGADALAELHTRVIDALDRGGKIACPSCGMQCVKDDACIHMDSCPCGSSWCFLCGKRNGHGEDYCTRGSGCDAQSCFLERHTGWGEFGINGETASQGAQKEYLRQRQAFLVRKLKEKADPVLWERLRNESPRLLKDVPTDGRDIDWDTLDTAEMPLFGSNKGTVNGADVAGALLADGDFAMDVAAARRLERHFAEELARAERAARADRMRRFRGLICILALLATVGGLFLLFLEISHPNPLSFVDPPSQRIPYIATIPNMSAVNCTINSAWRSHYADITWPNGTMCKAHGACLCAPPSPSANEATFCWDRWHQGCPDTKCKLIFWIPIVCVAVGHAAGVLLLYRGLDDAPSWGGMVLLGVLGLVAMTALCLWPVLVGPFGHWSYTLVAGPLCSGAVAPIFTCIMLAGLVDIDLDDEEWVSLGALLTLGGYLTNLISSIAVRSPVTIEGDVPADGCIHSGTALAQSVVESFDSSALSVYMCTPVCEAFRVTTMIVCATSCLSVLATAIKDREDVECSWLFTVPLCVALVFGATFWPLLLSASTLAGSGPWLYICIMPCIAIPWMSALGMIYAALENTLLGRCAWLDIIIREAFVGPALMLAGPLASGVLLYIFRSSPDDEMLMSPPLWSEIYQWEGVGILALCLLVAPFMIEDEDDFEDALYSIYAGGAFVSVWGLCMFFTASSWAFNLGCFIFVSFFWLLPAAAISLFISCVLADGDCDCCGFLGQIFATIMAFVVSAGALATMIVIYATDDYVALGDTSDLPTAFAVTGAAEAAINGLYIVRNDLDLTVCSNEDKEDIRDEEFCDVCGGLSSQFYHMVPGCDTQRCVMGHTDGLVLYQVLGSTMWVLANAEHAIESCGKDPTSLVHSLMVACYTSPSDAACESKWKEAMPDGNGTSTWVEVPAFRVTDSTAPSAATFACQPSVMLVLLFFLGYFL